ncbi:MAG TPA: acetyl-CoA hydrolase/transferase C-terminal domain-containing protein [Acidimicrobiales bacterium]|nr:acetyl-CoA hydrolase/transferase C-terminal domain-containing protein [Acidimicrobiales bacterium]
MAYADGPDGPLPDPDLIESVLGGPVELLLGWTVRTPTWLETSSAPVTTLMLGAGLRRAAGTGRVRAVATRLSAIPGLLAGRLRPDVAVVGAVEAPGTAAGWRLVGSPGWALAAVRAAGAVVVERWPAGGWSGGVPAGAGGAWGGPVPALGPPLPACRIAGVIDRADPPDPLPDNRTSPEHEEVGRLVAALIPENATVQWGPGAIAASVVAALDRPVRVRSGLVTDELVGLAERGLLAAPAQAAYLWGGPDLHAMAADGRLELRELSYTHDLTGISSTERFVAFNTALQVGLDGAANVESVGGRLVSGPGGHPDFAAGASRSPGGLSVVALTSTSGGRSNIVAAPDVVSTPRSDVDVVVTEHGVADLRGCSDRERAERIIGVAAPEHREALREALQVVGGAAGAAGPPGAAGGAGG